ncbi:muconolactone delta-isomerase [Pseudonocardia sp. CNS-139]|nr:muconolactone delta-isomerase [Pseudonocardia sp. CNS-139]
MEFLVRASNRLPADFPPERRAEMRTGERAIAARWRQEGMLQRLWRVPGRTDWIGLFTADDPTVLHDALTTLPMYPWLDLTVEPLSTHPQERAAETGPDGVPARTT